MSLVLIIIVVLALKPIEKNSHVFSHRGASGEEIEHTYKAYDLAIDYGSNYIEQDLVTSKDGTLYISHDLSAKRITKIDKEYRQMTDTEINTLRTEDGQHILSLEDVFDKYKNKTNFVVELKENEEQVYSFEVLIKKFKLEKNVVVQAKDLIALEKLEKTFPDMPKLALINTEEELEKALSADYVDIVGVNEKLMNSKNVKKAHRNNKEFNVWTLNSSNQIIQAIELNVDSYFTNFTAKALLLENEHRH